MMELRHNTASREARETGLSSARTPGQHLQDARCDAGLEIAEVAAQLHISENYVKSLEDDRYENLPTETFVVGYLRSYAKLVKLSPQRVVESYREYRHLMDDVVEPVVPAPIVEPPGMRLQNLSSQDVLQLLQDHRKIMVIVAVILLLWMLGYLLFSGPSESETSETAVPASNVAPAVEELPLREQPEPVEQPSRPDSQPKTPAENIENRTEDAEPESEVDLEQLARIHYAGAGAQASFTVQAIDDAAARDVQVSPKERLLPLLLDQLSIDFVDECWVEVTDARGDVLATDLFQKGQSLQLQGEAPFNVVLGNVQAARVRLNQAQVTLVAGNNRNQLKTTIGRR